MKRLIGLSKILIICMVVILTTIHIKSAPLSLADPDSKLLVNSISGQIWDPYNNPVSNVDVELMNELYSTISRQRTSSGGRYSFYNIQSGSYKVKVLTTGTNYLEQVQDIQIVNVFRGNSDQQYLDFHLKFDSRKINTADNNPLVSGEVFAQNIPDDARKHYKKGIELLADKKDEGLNEIEQSIKIFPEYFEALSRLGGEYVQRKEYPKSIPYLVKAIDVNQRSFSSFYALAYACYQLNQRSEALEAARAATIINPGSPNAQLLYGTVLRISGSYEKAEEALVKSAKLSKKPFAEVHWQLALLYNKTGRNKEAAEQLETFLKIQPDAGNKKEIQSLIAELQKTKEVPK